MEHTGQMFCKEGKNNVKCFQNVYHLQVILIGAVKVSYWSVTCDRTTHNSGYLLTSNRRTLCKTHKWKTEQFS